MISVRRTAAWLSVAGAIACGRPEPVSSPPREAAAKPERPAAKAAFSPALELRISVAQREAKIDDVVGIVYTLTNVGSTRLDLCVAEESLTHRLEGAHGGTMGFTSSTHPTCSETFALDPGGSRELRKEAAMQVRVSGPYRIDGTVLVLDPNDCGPFGCERTTIESKPGPTIELSRP